MSAEENIAIMKRVFQAFNDRDMSIIPQITAPGFVRHELAGGFGDTEGAEGVRNLYQQALQAIPDFQMKMDDIFATDTHVAVRFTVSGTHKGEFLGVAPTGKKVEYCQINLYCFQEGKCTESWQLMDVAGFLRQVGALKI